MQSAPPRRSPWAVPLLALATLGIYGAVWWARFGREVDDRTGGPIDARRHFRQVLVLFFAIVTIPVALVHFWVYGFKVTKATVQAARAHHVPILPTGALFALQLVPFLALVPMALLQRSANAAWAQAAPGPAAAPPPAAARAVRIQCPKCKSAVRVQAVAGQATLARCSQCGYSAPYG